MMRALVLVDIQNDFVTGGALAVSGGEEVVPVANALMGRFELVVAAQDWHPPDHGSFASQHPGHDVFDVIEFHGLEQILWPDHCVQGTTGAEFVAGLQTDRIDRVFQKGTDPAIDSYSAFFDNGHRQATGLGDYLKERGVDTVYVAGLTTEYCVKFSALDAVQLGFDTYVVHDGIRGVEMNEGDCAKAWDEMRAGGVHAICSDDVP